MESLINHIAKQAAQSFNEKLKVYLIENLNKLGYFFKDDFEFYAFAEERITRVLKDKSQSDEVQFYIDLGKKTQCYIGGYFENSEIEIVNEGVNVKFNVTFSKDDN